MKLVICDPHLDEHHGVDVFPSGSLQSTEKLYQPRLAAARLPHHNHRDVAPEHTVDNHWDFYLNTQWDNHWDVAPEHTVRQSLGCCTRTHSGTIIGMLHLNTQWDNHRDAAPEHTVGQSLGCLPEQSEAIPLSKGCRCHCPKVVDATRLNSMGTCHKTKLYGYMPQD